MPENPSQSDLSVEMVDTELRDSELPDSELPDAELPDAELPDAELPDAELPDAELPDAELPDAGEVFSQAAALAQHLQQAGVQWLPRARTDEVEHLIAQFQSFSASPNPNDNTSAQTTPQQHGTGQHGTGQHGTGQQGTQRSDSDNQRSETQRATPDQNRSPLAAGNAEADAGQTRSTGHLLQVIDGPYPGVDLPNAQRSKCLAELSDQVASCQRCPQLTRHRNHTVFGEGNDRPRVVFFGEAPGADEDRTGRPFVGAAGQLLTKMIEACKFSREDVYILNTIKCRPPNNRNPELEERDNCRDFYRGQLNTLRPEYIVCLGAVAAQELLQSKVSVGSLRGKFHRYHESKVLVTYHPAYLLREPTRKAAAWQDLQLMLRDAKIDF